MFTHRPLPLQYFADKSFTCSIIKYGLKIHPWFHIMRLERPSRDKSVVFSQGAISFWGKKCKWFKRKLRELVKLCQTLIPFTSFDTKWIPASEQFKLKSTSKVNYFHKPQKSNNALSAMKKILFIALERVTYRILNGKNLLRRKNHRNLCLSFFFCSVRWLVKTT